MNTVKYSFITLHLALFKTKYPTKNHVVHCYIKIRQNAFFFLIKGLHAETQFTRLLSRPVEKLGGHKNNKILTYGG